MYLSAYEDGPECSETSAYKIQTPGTYLEESIQQLYLSDHKKLDTNVHSIFFPSHNDQKCKPPKYRPILNDLVLHQMVEYSLRIKLKGMDAKYLTAKVNYFQYLLLFFL